MMMDAPQGKQPVKKETCKHLLNVAQYSLASLSVNFHFASTSVHFPYTFALWPLGALLASDEICGSIKPIEFEIHK